MGKAELGKMIEALRERIRGLERRDGWRCRGVLPFGVDEIDRALPDGGLALGGLHEIEGAGLDLAHGAAAALFVAAILARMEGPVLWCLAARDLFAPGLAAVGLDPGRVIYAEARATSAVLPLVEEALRHPGLAGVVGESDRLGRIPSRRLQLAAEGSGVTGFIIRRPRTAAKAETEPNVAVTRWRVASLPIPPEPAPGPLERLIGSRRAARLLTDRGHWRLDLTRCRGGEPRSWVVSEPDAAGRMDIADIPAQQARLKMRTAGVMG